jgi:hypothetical protein
MEAPKSHYNLIRSLKIVVWALIVIAIAAMLLGFFIGRNTCADSGSGSVALAKKQYELDTKELKKDHYRLVMLDSSLAIELNNSLATIDGMQQREKDLKYQLDNANNASTKYKSLYEKLNRYDTFTGADIRRYFADSINYGARPRP